MEGGEAPLRVCLRVPYRGFIFDLDGTVYLGEQLLPGAKAVIGAIRDAGRALCFLSNKPIASRVTYAEKLTRLGVPTAVDEVINSSYVLARYLAREAPGRAATSSASPRSRRSWRRPASTWSMAPRWTTWSSPSTGRSPTASSMSRSRPSGATGRA
jgi:hypothetical protein